MNISEPEKFKILTFKFLDATIDVRVTPAKKPWKKGMCVITLNGKEWEVFKDDVPKVEKMARAMEGKNEED